MDSNSMRAIAAIMSIALAASATAAFAQDDNIPFHEIARVVVNATDAPSAIVSVTLQSTSLDDMQIAPELAGRIAADDRIAYIALTNEGACVLGVGEESCILVSILRSGEWKTIEEIQSGAREIGDSYIDGLNEALDTRAEFHSVFIHYDAGARLGQASDRRIVSAVYTLPLEDTASMFAKIGGIVLSPEIRRGGGFYDAARHVIAGGDTDMLFSITPIAGSHLFQMRVSAQTPVADIYNIDPATLLSTDPIERSAMFAQGSNPLGSIVQVVVLSPENVALVASGSPVLPTREIDGEQVPLSVSSAGWVFDPVVGKIIKGKYIFGTSDAASREDLAFALANTESRPPIQDVPTFSVPTEVLVIMLAAIVGVGAIVWYVTRRP